MHRDIVNVGVIGCGGAAEIGHLPWIGQNPKAKLVAVADLAEEKARAAAHRWGAESWYTNAEELLNREDIHAVSICTPVHLHCEHAVEAAERDKDILLEKPMARDMEECDQITRACDKAGVKLMIGFMKRFNPGHQRIKEILSSGKLGTPHYCDIHWSMFDISEASSGFRYKAYTGGGVFQDHGSHYIDQLRWWIGEISEVTAEFNVIVRGREVEDHGVALLRFNNGALATLEATRVGPSGKYGLWERGQIYVTNGALAFDVPDWKSFELPEIELFRGRGWEEERLTKLSSWPPEHYSFRRQMDAWIDCILEDKEPPTTGEDGRAAVEVINAAYLSQLAGEKVRLPISQRRIGAEVFGRFPRFN